MERDPSPESKMAIGSFDNLVFENILYGFKSVTNKHIIISLTFYSTDRHLTHNYLTGLYQIKMQVVR